MLEFLRMLGQGKLVKEKLSLSLKKNHFYTKAFLNNRDLRALGKLSHAQQSRVQQLALGTRNKVMAGLRLFFILFQ